MSLCKNNCGFYGNENLNGYCSQCFKSLAIEAQVSLENGNKKEERVTTQPKPQNRCRTCRKKIGIYGFSCQCDGYFCTVHRYPEFHDCSFDYKKAGREKISKENQEIKGSKINKI